MSITRIPGLEAVRIRRANPQARWPARGEEFNRVEPLAAPAFEAPFRLRPGESIFTIGSCFARNIEQELSERGFDVPVLRLLKQEAFAGVTSFALNNYGVSSIMQELQWAFDPAKPFRPEVSFLEVEPGGFVDLHLYAGIGPQPYERVAQRRRAIVECTRQLGQCRVVVITLGLAEVWWDAMGQAYVNETPPSRFVEANPGRFELHVLDYAEILAQLRAALTLIRRHAAEAAQVILTVSPVPLTATHRPMDVMVANTYSKSVLRAAAEAVVGEFDFVHYFPSYESVVLSDRSRTWKEDQVHVTAEVVRLNVERMLSAYLEAPARLPAQAVLERLDALRKGGVRTQWNFLNEHRDVVADDARLAVQFARIALHRGDPESAAWAAGTLAPLAPPFLREALLAETAIAEGDGEAALRLIESTQAIPVPRNLDGRVGRETWRLRTLAHLALKDRDRAVDAAIMWSKQTSPGAPFLTPFLYLARGLRDMNLLEDAAHFFEQAAPAFTDNATVRLERAEVLLRCGRQAEAAAILGALEAGAPREIQRRDALLAFIPPQRRRGEEPTRGAATD